MKKIYLSIFTICSVALGLNAQIELTDDFDSYTLGDISSQAAHWRTWSGVEGGAEDADVIDFFAHSGAQSMNIDGGGIMDELLKIPSLPTMGIYTLQWWMLVPADRTGYFNMQGSNTADGTAWVQHLNGGNVYFNQDGLAPGVGAVDGTPGNAFAYPEDTWFKITCIYDLTAETWDMEIDGTPQFTGQEFTFNQAFEELAAIDFFSVDGNNEYYVDDVTEAIGLLGTDDFSTKGFSAYPNPVKNVLNLNAKEAISSVSIYNVLGQEIYTANVDALSTSIDTSSFSSGAYFVRVNVNGTEGTVKILK